MSNADIVEEDGGEGYFASVSDLMVGILFVFLLMLTVFALNFRDTQDAVETVPKPEFDAMARLRDSESQRADREKERADAAERATRVAQDRAATAELEAQRQRGIAQTLTVEVKALTAETQTLTVKVQALTEDIRQLRALLTEAAQRLKRQEELEARRELLVKLQDRLKQNQINVEIDPSSAVLRLPDGVLRFKSRSSDLDALALQNLRQISDALREYLPCFAAQATPPCKANLKPVVEAVLIEGHTDGQPFGILLPPIINPTGAVVPNPIPRYRRPQTPQEKDLSKALNDRLASDRALKVFEVMQQSPVFDLIKNGNDQPVLGVSAYGERRPLERKTNMTDKAFDDANRRIDLRFVLSTQPSGDLEDLQRRIQNAVKSTER